MKIAIVHSYYSRAQPSGENDIVDLQIDALQRAGHAVLPLVRVTDDLKRKPGYPARSAVRLATGYDVSPLPIIREFGVDIIHVHNLFPNFGHRWLSRIDTPVVATLHNFRPLCASGTLYRRGNLCTACLGKTLTPGLLRGCYRDSRLATLPLWLRNPRGATADPVLAIADRIVVLSERSRSIYTSVGISESKITVIPNPGRTIPPPTDRGPDRRRSGWVFVGRLCEEKGIEELLREWPREHDLRVIGDGPLLDRLKAMAGSNIAILGQLTQQQVEHELAHSVGMVFPSRCYEGAPARVYVQALAASTPVLALANNSVADDVAEYGTGVVINAVTSGSLARGIAYIQEHAETLSANSLKRYHSQFTVQAWTSRLTDLYQELALGMNIAKRSVTGSLKGNMNVGSPGQPL